MKKISFLIFGLLVSVNFLLAQQVTITGKVINNNNNFTQIQLTDLVKRQAIATANLDKDGKFSITVSIDYPNFYSLGFSNRNYILLVLKPGDKISVTYDAATPKNSVVNGSQLTDVLKESDKADKEIAQEYKQCQQKIEQHRLELYKNIVLNNLGKISTLIIAQKLPMDEYIDTHLKLAKSLKPYSANPYVKQYIQNVEAQAKMRLGTVAPDIALPNTKGDTVRLSSLRGKYVLVDFWASWCRPCRMESPNLVEAYNAFHNKGFTIYSVSLDNNRQAWLNAIQHDNLGQWYHVSDLKGWHSSAAALYGVNSIPSNFLLDPQGRIIAKNLRGPKLKEKLSQIFSQKNK